MSSKELKICVEAVRWFKSKKPIDFTEEEHLLNPQVNCKSITEKRLAIAVAKLLLKYIYL